MQNVQRVKVELRDKDPIVNVVTRSGMATRGPEEEATMGPLIHQVVIKKEGLELKRGKHLSHIVRNLLMQRKLLLGHMRTSSR